MKKAERNIICAWVLLLFFAVGQLMLFAHQHRHSIVISAKSGEHIVKEKCDFCDVMHHSHMLLTKHIYFTPAIAITFHYQDKPADIKLIQLILASGRAPPIS